MSVFTEKEIQYLEEQRLGRLATVDAEGRPHVVPVAFRFNAQLDAVDIGGTTSPGARSSGTPGRPRVRRS